MAPKHALLLAMLLGSCSAHSPEAPALAPPAPLKPAAPTAPAPLPPAPPASAAAEAARPKLPPLIYRRVADSTLGDHRFELEGPLPADYVLVPTGDAPRSLKELLRNRKRIFVREAGSEEAAGCTALVLDRVGARKAALHHDETDKECSVRYPVRLEYEHASLAAAAIDYHTGEPRILRGCPGRGFGIALCGWPVLLVVGADEHGVRFVDARAHIGNGWELYAYDSKTVIEWYFDAEECARAAPPASRGGCG